MSTALRLAAGVDPGTHVADWLGAPELARLVEAFGGPEPAPNAPAAVTLARLDAFSERWNFRAGRERNEAADAHFTGAQRSAIADAARALGQLDLELPEAREWDVIVVLGGLVRACISRPVVTAALLAEDRLSTREVLGIGALRGINDGERALAARIPDIIPPGEVPRDELDAMTLGFRHAFGLDGVFDETGENHASIDTSWRERRYRTHVERTYRIIAAPAPRPGGRATTSDVLAWFGRRDAVAAGTRILLITTEIYRHYFLVDAVRTLGLCRGAIVDCLGISPAQADPRLAMEFPHSDRLQEIRSSIRALRALADALG